MRNYALDITGQPTQFAPMSAVLAEIGGVPTYGALLGTEQSDAA